jgi:hypothetical protein
MLGLFLSFTIAQANPLLSQVPAARQSWPLSFELNQGQSAADVKFLSHGSAWSLFLTSEEAVMALGKEDAGSEIVRMKFQGATAAPFIQGLDALKTGVNYLIGADPRSWKRNVPNYSRVKYHGLYPKTDLVFYGNESRLEYDFVLQPGADPASIQLAFSGPPEIRISDRGDLVLKLERGALQFHKPVVYQESNRTKTMVEGAYRLLSSNLVGFQIGNYDPALPVVIDPIASYSTFLGAAAFDEGNAIAADKFGNAYIAGQTNASDFPTKNPYDPTLNGCCDIFVTKLNKTGTSQIYSTYIGGNDSENALSIAVDGAGNVYITGYTGSQDFPHSGNAYDTTFNGPINDIFVLKLDPTGSSLLYSTYFGGSDDAPFETGMGVKPAFGKIYITGYTTATNLPLKNAYQSDQPGEDAFVAAFNPGSSGEKSLVWSTYFGGNGTDDGWAIAARKTAAGGMVVITGNTSSTDLPLKKEIQGNQPGVDAFIARFSPNGSLLYSTYYGGDGLDMAFAIVLDAAGRAYVTGTTLSTDLIISTGAYDETCGDDGLCGGGGNAFALKLDDSGSLMAATYLGGSSGYVQGRGIALHPGGAVLIAGTTLDPALPVTPDAFDPSCGADGACDTGLCSGNACEDVFLTALKPGFTKVLYTTYVGGAGQDMNTGGNVIATNTKGRIFLTGRTTSIDFPSFPANVFDPECGSDGTCNSESDAFVFQMVPGTP